MAWPLKPVVLCFPDHSSGVSRPAGVGASRPPPGTVCPGAADSCAWATKGGARERAVLVDGFLAPTWSWRDTPELWSGKHKTTGFNGQAIANLRGDLLFVSEPITGHNHDMTALAETETADILAAAYSGIGDKGYQGSDFITPFKKPQGGGLLDWQKEFNVQVNKLRAPVERAIAHLKSWRILHTDYRRPLRTYAMSYRAAVGLYFFKLNFE